MFRALKLAAALAASQTGDWLYNVALLALVMISSLAGEKFVWKESALVSAVLIVSSWLLFVRGLGLQFNLWPAFLGR